MAETAPWNLSLRLSEAIAGSSYEAFVVGVPKTIDNDLADDGP